MPGMGGELGNQRSARHAGLRVHLQPDDLAGPAFVVAEVGAGDAAAADGTMRFDARDCEYFGKQRV